MDIKCDRNSGIKRITITKEFFSIEHMKVWWKERIVIDENNVWVYEYDDGDLRKPVYKEKYNLVEDASFYELLNDTLNQNGVLKMFVDDCSGEICVEYYDGRKITAGRGTQASNGEHAYYVVCDYLKDNYGISGY